MQDSDRVYSPDEIQGLLKRASEIQGARPLPTTHGLSLAEVQELAEDAGIDPELILAASLEHNTGRAARKKTWYGGPFTSTIVRSVEGKISDDTWEKMLAEIRREFKVAGETVQRGSTREWVYKTTWEGTHSHLNATYRDGRTEIEWMDTSKQILAAPFVIAPFLLSVLSLGVISGVLDLGAATGVPSWIASILVFLAAARYGLGWASDKGYASNSRLVDDLLTIAHRDRARTTSGLKSTATEGAAAAEAAAEAPESRRDPVLELPDDELGDAPAPSKTGRDRTSER
ncbi:MAG: hypothetical protein ACI80V_002935 [Rhodothermales bacterium]|jgi:hypothetical protein